MSVAAPVDAPAADLSTEQVETSPNPHTHLAVAHDTEGMADPANVGTMEVEDATIDDDTTKGKDPDNEQEQGDDQQDEDGEEDPICESREALLSYDALACYDGCGAGM